MHSFKKIGLLIFLVVGSIIILFIVIHIKNSQKEFTVFTTPVEKGRFVISIKARGEVIPSKEYKIVSLISGLLLDKVLVDEGDNVRVGQLLLTLDKTELLLKLNEVEKNIIDYRNQLKALDDSLDIKRAEKHLTEAKLAFEDANREYNSLSRLYKMNAISAEELKNSQSKLLKSEENLRLAEKELMFSKREKEHKLNLVLAQLKEAEANYSWIKKQISLSTYTSPINGVVIKKNPELSSKCMISSGMHLFTITLPSYKVKVLIDEVDIGKIHIGQKATVTIDAYPYKPLPTIIKSISPVPIQEKKDITSFEVYLEDFNIDNLKVMPGMKCSMEIEQVLETLKVALEDVIEEEGKRYVFLIEGGKAKKKLIKIGMENEQEGQILSGLKEKDRIIKSPSLIKGLEDGVKVNDKSSKNIKDL